MKLTVRKAPWYRTGPVSSWGDLEQLLVGSWSQAAIEFYAVRVARKSVGKKAPKGLQPFLNSVLEQRFSDAGWDGDGGGRFWTEDRWVRITFRHQMSLGSDFIDALKVARKSGFNELMIAAPSASFLTVISPNDAQALTSGEKVWAEAVDLEGCLDIPLLVGTLEALSPLPSEVAEIVHAARPRDVYRPES